jgi:tetratricopeptide (TPR) repeat protein
MRYLASLLTSLAVGLTLQSCATVTDSPEPPAAPTPTVAETAPTPPPAPEPIEYGNFTEEQLYQAIISELSAQRGQIPEAGQGYFELAFSTRDLGIIQRAVQFASINNDLNGLLQLGLLWAEVAPEDPQPHLLLSFQFIESGDFQQALSHMSRVIDLGGRIDFSVLSNRTGRLTPQARAGLIANLQELSQEYPHEVSISTTLVRLLAQNQQYAEALAELQKIQQQQPNDAAMFLLEAQLHQSMDQVALALRTLRTGTRQFPDDRNLRFNYARVLIQNDDYPGAQEQFRILVEQDPRDWETLYSIALLDIEMKNYDDAARSLQRLVGVDQRADESQFYLGYIYEQQGRLEEAIDHYRQVRIGTQNFLAAQQQATRFSIQLGQLQDAHQWLSRLSRGQPRLDVVFTTIESGALLQAGYSNEAKQLLDTALNRYPNEVDLLFARVLYFDSLGDQAGSEQDLRQIILMQPEDARALNHLGYMLADQTERYEEALDLLERATAADPEDPAIMDSLGWAQYKLGRYDEALENLRRAFALFPDHEVASHLGEVLWMMGRHEEASTVWNNALEERPDSELIRAVIERFQPAS